MTLERFWFGNYFMKRTYTLIISDLDRSMRRISHSLFLAISMVNLNKKQTWLISKGSNHRQILFHNQDNSQEHGLSTKTKKPFKKSFIAIQRQEEAYTKKYMYKATTWQFYDEALNIVWMLHWRDYML